MGVRHARHVLHQPEQPAILIAVISPGKTLTIRGADRSLWQQLRNVALAKGSPSYYCLNSAVRSYIAAQGSVRG